MISCIDYILISGKYRKEVVDVRVKREAEIYSDHYLVSVKMKLHLKQGERHETKRQEAPTNNTNKVIKSYKLQETETAHTFKKEIYQEIAQTMWDWETMDLENLWQTWHKQQGHVK